MRWFVLTATVLVALAGAAYAFGGASSSPGNGAYALVVGTSGTPQLIQSHTNGFVSANVGTFGQGDYCLTPAPGVDVVHTAAVASEEANYSSAIGVPTVRYPTSSASAGCNAGQLEVKTFDSSVALSNQIAFTVNVP